MCPVRSAPLRTRRKPGTPGEGDRPRHDHLTGSADSAPLRWAAPPPSPRATPPQIVDPAHGEGLTRVHVASAVLQRDRAGDAEPGAGIAQVPHAREVHQDGHVGSCALQGPHAAQGATHREACGLQGGGEELRVLEAVAAAAAHHKLVEDRTRVVAEQHLHVAERERENVCTSPDVTAPRPAAPPAAPPAPQ